MPKTKKEKIIYQNKYKNLFKLKDIFLSFLKKWKITILLILLLFLLLFSFFTSNSNLAQNSLKTKMAYPFLLSTRLNLVNAYYDYGYLDLAQNEFSKINNSFILKYQLKLVPNWQEKYKQAKVKIESKERIETEIKKWENWIINNPPSRDIYLNLSELYWQIKNNNKAKYYLNKASYLDPANQDVIKMEKLIKNNQ